MADQASFRSQEYRGETHPNSAVLSGMSKPTAHAQAYGVILPRGLFCCPDVTVFEEEAGPEQHAGPCA